MKKVYFIIVFILVILILLTSGFFYWFKKESQPVSSTFEKVSFLVENGASATEVGELLFRKNLIRNRLVFKLYLHVLDKTKNINAGEFELSPSMSLPEIISAFGGGPKEIWVLIPEGLRKEEVVEKIIQSLEIADVKANDFRNEFLALSETSEGYLFPDTYLFPREVSAADAYEKLRSTFDDKFESNIGTLLKESKYSKKEIVIMASILERETKSFEERPIVAGILWKRIENGWPLQVDAGVQYAVANSKIKTQSLKSFNWWPILTLDDLNIDSPYNTYKYKGLPPAPISNPGLSSLKSAVSSEGSDYWFYIHSPDGTVHYAKTAAEHAINVQKYLGKK
jgi:UPF0755 protein